MWNMVTGVVVTMVGMTTLVGVVVRFALVPYMRGQLVDPIALQLASIIQLANDASNQVGVIVRAWDGHLEWSQREVDRLWEQLLINERLKNRGGDRSEDQS